MIRWLVVVSLVLCISAYGREKAILEVILYEQDKNGEFKTYTSELVGHYSSASKKTTAEGDIVQVNISFVIYYCTRKEFHMFAYLDIWSKATVKITCKTFTMAYRSIITPFKNL